jgi:HD-GYP domain-containing protein (c-di-GMP phosphodiesterase class II)
MRQRFLLKDGDAIQKMKRQGMDAIYIDTDKGDDVADAPTETEIREVVDRQLKVSAEAGSSAAPARVSHKEESIAARRIMSEASGVVDGMLQDVRLGRQVDIAKAAPLVREINASVLRNPGALISLGRIKAADSYTFQHSVSICALLVSFTHALGMDSATVEEAGVGGLLHDMGKMKVPNEILNKPGRLTEEEFAIMKTHAAHSRDLLTGMPGVSDLAVRIASEHHEKMGGGGYPRGISGGEISQIGRMAAIVDVYDAITSNRVYHKGLEPSEALKKLLEWSGSHLDGDLVQQFVRALGIYPVGSLVRLSSGLLAVVTEQGEDLLRPSVRVIFDADRRMKVQPRELDLTEFGEQIESYEDPADWGYTAADLLV